MAPGGGGGVSPHPVTGNATTGSRCSPRRKSNLRRVGASHRLKIAPAFRRGAGDLAGGSAAPGAPAVKSSRPPPQPHRLCCATEVAAVQPPLWHLTGSPGGLGTPCRDPPPKDGETESQGGDRLSRRAKGDEGVPKGSALPRVWHKR